MSSTDIETALYIDGDRASITVAMPYLADVSVNHAYNRGNPASGVKQHVENWLTCLLICARNLVNTAGGDVLPPVTLDLEIVAPGQRGRLPDTSNFRKLIQDVLAVALGVDDVIFGGTDTPARRATAGEDPIIKIRLEWGIGGV